MFTALSQVGRENRKAHYSFTPFNFVQGAFRGLLKATGMFSNIKRGKKKPCLRTPGHLIGSCLSRWVGRAGKVAVYLGLVRGHPQIPNHKQGWVTTKMDRPNLQDAWHLCQFQGQRLLELLGAGWLLGCPLMPCEHSERWTGPLSLGLGHWGWSIICPWGWNGLGAGPWSLSMGTQ